MKIYLDTCCYCRPFDNLSVPQNKAEAEALYRVVKACKAASIKIVGSNAVVFELFEICDAQTRVVIEAYYESTIDGSISLGDTDDERASELRGYGVGVMDSYHLTAAERGGVDFLLTTDKKFLNKVTKNNLTFVQVMNPINFLPEVVGWLR